MVTFVVDQVPVIMPWYPMQSHYPDTQPTSPYHIIIMPSAWLESDKYQFESHYLTGVWTCKVRIPRFTKTGDGCSTHLAIPSSPLFKHRVDVRKTRLIAEPAFTSFNQLQNKKGRVLVGLCNTSENCTIMCRMKIQLNLKFSLIINS